MPGGGLALRHNTKGILFNGPRTRHQVVAITDFEFADDAVLVAHSRQVAVSAREKFHHVCQSFGLNVNFSKTKFLVCGTGSADADHLPISITGQHMECVSSFVHLSRLILPRVHNPKEYATACTTSIQRC
eukprot:scpid91996/ scgid23366/ 